MNEIFNIKRFGLLIRMYHRENLKFHLLAIGVMIISTWLILCNGDPFQVNYYYGNAETIKSIQGATISIQYITFWLLLILFSGIYSARSFRNYTDKTKAVNSFLLPASTLEKYLVVFFYTVIVFSIVYTLLFYAVDWCVWQYHIGYVIGTWEGEGVQMFDSWKDLTNYFGEHEILRANLINVFKMSKVNYMGFNLSNPNMTFGLFSWLAILIICAVQALFMLGSIWFRKYPILKISLLQFMAWFVLTFISYHVTVFICEYYNADGGLTISAMCGDSHLSVYAVNYNMCPDELLFLFVFLFPLSYFVSAFFKLKEKQL